MPFSSRKHPTQEASHAGLPEGLSTMRGLLIRLRAKAPATLQSCGWKFSTSRECSPVFLFRLPDSIAGRDASSFKPSSCSVAAWASEMRIASVGSGVYLALKSWYFIVFPVFHLPRSWRKLHVHCRSQSNRRDIIFSGHTRPSGHLDRTGT